MKKLIFFITIAICLSVIENFIASIYQLLYKKDVLIQVQNELQKEEQENKRLKDQLNRVKNPQFVEEQARDKLFLTKPGESVILIPSFQASDSGKTVKKEEKPNWQQWWDLFF